jgi:tetratricopeptide (TPR) repeat protein
LDELGRYADARPKLEEALQTSPSDANVELFLANDLTKTGDFVAAARHFENLSARRPKDPHLQYLLAKVYMQLGQQTLAKMNAIDPDSVGAHEISGEIEAEDMKNYDGAIIEYKKRSRLLPSSRACISSSAICTGACRSGTTRPGSSAGNSPSIRRTAWRNGSLGIF